MAGASNAKTILILAAFNRTCSYMIYRKYGIKPYKTMPATIRADIRKFLNKKGRLSKDDIYDEVRKKYTNFLPYIMDKGKNKGMERKENFDVADAIACVWSWIITHPEVDRTGSKSFECKKGSYQETTFFDDRDGVLHCNKCNHQIKRYSRI